MKKSARWLAVSFFFPCYNLLKNFHRGSSLYIAQDGGEGAYDTSNLEMVYQAVYADGFSAASEVVARGDVGAGNTAYVSDSSGCVFTLDITDPAKPVVTGSLSVSDRPELEISPQHVAVHNGYLYVSTSAHELQVYKIAGNSN